MKRSEILFIAPSYLIWICVLLLIILFATKFLPPEINFLGGGLSNYLKNPYLWSFSNFDGEHYISIAQNGYQPLTYFFFPLYPFLVKVFSPFLGDGLFSYLSSGLLVSNLSFITALFGLYKLLKIDFKDNAVKRTILLLLLFPTSFYFASVYTESLFLALVVWSFYFMRCKKWGWAGVLGGLASICRLIGVILFVVAIIEYFDIKFPLKIKFKFKKDFFWLGLIPLGLVCYLLFVWHKTGDPLNFYNTVSIFGSQRSSNLISLPQVFYRYFFKVLPNVNYSVMTSFLAPLLEVTTGIVFTVLTVASFFKLRLSYAVYLAIGFIIPTLSGSFSSLPRYVLVLFPAFILISQYLSKNKVAIFAFYGLLFILLIICFAMFARGYWIS